MLSSQKATAQLTPPIDKKDYDLYMRQQEQLRKKRMALWTSAAKKIYLRSMKLNDSKHTVNVQIIWNAGGKYGVKEMNFSDVSAAQIDRDLADLMRSLPQPALIRNYDRLDSMMLFQKNETKNAGAILPEKIIYKVYCEDIKGELKYYGSASVINPGDAKTRALLDEMFTAEFKK